jgi:hypothetical protein
VKTYVLYSWSKLLSYDWLHQIDIPNMPVPAVLRNYWLTGEMTIKGVCWHPCFTTIITDHITNALALLCRKSSQLNTWIPVHRIARYITNEFHLMLQMGSYSCPDPTPKNRGSGLGLFIYRRRSKGPDSSLSCKFSVSTVNTVKICHTLCRQPYKRKVPYKYVYNRT